MKVNIDELQIKRAKTHRSVNIIENKYKDGMNGVTRQSFNISVPFYMTQGTVVVLHKEKVIAMCIYSEDTIYGVCVEKEYRGNGISRLLMNECIGLMKQVLPDKGFHKIKLFSHNPVAQNLYESMGFKLCSDPKYANKNYELEI